MPAGAGKLPTPSGGSRAAGRRQPSPCRFRCYTSLIKTLVTHIVTPCITWSDVRQARHRRTACRAGGVTTSGLSPPGFIPTGLYPS